MNILRALVAVASILLSEALIAAEHYIMTTIGVCSIPSCAPGSPPAWDSGAWVESRLLGFPTWSGCATATLCTKTMSPWSAGAVTRKDIGPTGTITGTVVRSPVTVTTLTWIPQPALRRRTFRPRIHGANAGRLEEAAAEWKTMKGIVRSC